MRRSVFAIAAILAASTTMPPAFANEKENNVKNNADKLMMLSVAVNDMAKAKEFYADKLGLKVVSDNRIDDQRWWVSLTPPGGGPAIVLTTAHENMKPGTMKLYFATSDVAASHDALSSKGVQVGGVKDDLFGPGSGVKWCQLRDPDNNQVLLVQAER